MAASAFAASVFPTPACPSIRSGFPSFIEQINCRRQRPIRDVSKAPESFNHIFYITDLLGHDSRNRWQLLAPSDPQSLGVKTLGQVSEAGVYSLNPGIWKRYTGYDSSEPLNIRRIDPATDSRAADRRIGKALIGLTSSVAVCPVRRIA